MAGVEKCSSLTPETNRVTRATHRAAESTFSWWCFVAAGDRGWTTYCRKCTAQHTVQLQTMRIFFEARLSDSQHIALQRKQEPNKAHWQWKPQPHRARLSAGRQAFQPAPDLTAKTLKSYHDCQESLALNLQLTFRLREFGVTGDSCDRGTVSSRRKH